MSEQEMHRVLRRWIWSWATEHAPTTMIELHAAALDNFASDHHFVAWLVSEAEGRPPEEVRALIREPLAEAVEQEARTVFEAVGHTLSLEGDRIVRREAE